MARGKRYGRSKRAELRSRRIENLSNQHKLELLIGYGIFAPSTHNTQPWKVQIASDESIDVYADLTKQIPEADPTNRDLFMSVGAFIKNIEIAAKEFSLKPKITFSRISLESEYIAHIEFGNLDKAVTPKSSERLDAITTRQNYRGFFTEEKLNKKLVNEILASSTNNDVEAKYIDDEKTVEQMAKLTAEGLKIAYATPTFRREISSFINHNFSRKRYGLHGYSLRMNLPTSLIVPRIMKRKDIGGKLAVLNYKSFITASGVIVLSSLDEPSTWVRCGMVLEETMLLLEKNGISSSIYAAAIEMSDLRAKLRMLLKMPAKGLTPQLLFCIGNPSDRLPHSVRKNPGSIIVK